MNHSIMQKTAACKWKLRLYAWGHFFFVEPQLDCIEYGRRDDRFSKRHS